MHNCIHTPGGSSQNTGFDFFLSFFLKMSSLWLSWPVLFYATTWTVLLAFTVAVASFSPEVAFVSAVSPSSSFSNRCKSDGFIRVPLDVPGDILCFPALLFNKSKLDLIVPPVFAAVIVAASASVVKALGLWGNDQPA